ncbi:MAG: hypothetical protein IPN32_32875 [Deltaproteobacteria bacterium]|nr:hypothetical protein [Deltaproteobacteria bacterium]
MPIRAAAPLSLALLVACAGTRTHRRGGDGPTTPFVDAPAAGVDDAEVDRLAALEHGDSRARAVRLARLLDLFDAARMGDDADARDVLWAALGGHGTGRGVEATREALSRLLAIAMALDEAGIADDDAAQLVHDAIAMLSSDLQPPGDAEGLAIRTLSYRTLAESGHPQIRDNARWRLFDHARTTLHAAIEAAPAQREAIAQQIRYIEVEDLGDVLDDGDVHLRPRWPGPVPLVALVTGVRTELAAQPTWSSLLQRRAALDEELERVALATLPAARAPDPMGALRPRGTGVPESMAPVVRIAGGQIELDVGRPQSRRLPLDDDDITAIADAIEAVLLPDGRGTLLLVVEPQTPAPQLRRALRALRRGGAARIELAIAEPHERGGTVTVALPLVVVRAQEAGVGGRALQDARIDVHVGGRGFELAIDGAWLQGTLGSGAELERRLDELRRAYPRERTVTIDLGLDAAYEQILDAAIATAGGASPRFAVLGWLGDESRPAGTPSVAAGERLAARLAWAALGARLAIEQPFPLAGDDQPRLEAFAAALPRCLPELPRKPAPRTAVRVDATLSEGRVAAIAVAKLPGLSAKELVPLQRCLEDEALGVRFREHRDTIAITLRAGP